MRTSTILGLLTALGANTVTAQSGAWEQCGGLTWTGATTCVSGYYCFYYQPYYSQCIPGTASSVSSAATSSSKSSSSSSKSSTATTLSTKTSSSTRISTSTSSSKSSSSSSISRTSSSTKSSSSSKASSSSSASKTSSGACTATFTPITASAAYAALNPGWNLGNTLDAIPDEGSWNNVPVIASTFANVQAKGFKSVRIPVTWAYHFDTGSPSWTVTTAWMDRVEVVVDEALALGLYVILNVHHDSWIWADVSASGANLTMIEEKFLSLWTQIGTRFKCKSSKLLFEAINEPPGTTQAHGDELNKLNGLFLQGINAAGGYNPQRVVSLCGPGMDSAKTSLFFKAPTTFLSQPWGIQFHYYSPYDFIFGAWGKTIWGSDADKSAMLSDFSFYNGNFTGIPTFIGEWEAAVGHTETAARWKYFDYFLKTAKSFGYSTILWDNGLGAYDRTNNVWYDPAEVNILLSATAGVSNALADSSEDGSATSWTSSAYLFHKVGDAVVAQTASYTLNGNSLLSIKNSAGTTLTSSQYSISGGVVTFTAAYLSTLYSASSAAGIKDTLTLTFSAGAALSLTVVQYDTPTITTSTIAVNTAADYLFPITYKGLPQVAAVKAMLADGTYLADSWTVYLGPLQNARWTYGNWDFDAGNFIIRQSGMTALKASGQTVTLTVEFFPRSVGANSLTITVTQ